MSDLLTLLKVGADVKLTKEQAQYLADLIEKQQARIAELEQREQELAATVERLRGLFGDFENDPNDSRIGWNKKTLEVLRATPHQNLNAVKREVYADGFYQGFSDAWCSNFDWEQDHVHYGLEQSEIRAEQEYPSDKD